MSKSRRLNHYGCIPRRPPRVPSFRRTPESRNRAGCRIKSGMTQIGPLPAVVSLFGGWLELTDSRKLITGEYFDHTPDTERIPHNNPARALPCHPTDNGCRSAVHMVAHDLQEAFRIFFGNHGHELALVGQVKMIEPEHLACPFHRVRNGNPALLDLNADL